MTNNSANVRVVQDGQIFLGAYGAPGPTSAAFVPGVEYSNFGYYSEDGFNITPNAGDNTEFAGHNGDIVASISQPGSWAVAFSAIEALVASIEAYYDTTVLPDGSFQVDSAAVDTYRSLLTIGISGEDLVLTHYPRVKVSDRESVTSNRTTLSAYGMTFQTFKDPVFGYQFRQWDTKLVAAPAAPAIVRATPSGALAGAVVKIEGDGFAGASAVKFGAVAATNFLVVSGGLITATVPAGTAGSAAITVTNSTGTNTAFPYTRGA